MLTTLDLAKALINRPSVTPDDQGCQQFIADYLTPLGFTAEHLRFGEVDNLWIHHGKSAPTLVFAGHTDVVPTGPVEQWTHPPFTATLADHKLYGRGSADMKVSVAAMTQAAYEFVKENPHHQGKIALLITSDEEGPGIDGTVKVCEFLQAQKTTLDYCVVGEPSCVDTFGDTIKNGRRGSLTATLTVYGKQGHVAYPHLVRNPIHLAAPALAKLCQTQWDQGNRYFPPTTMQISNFNSGTGATNVVPGQAHIVFNFRFSTESTPESLKARVHAILDAHGLDYKIDWVQGGEPFLTPVGTLSNIAVETIQSITGVTPKLSTTGGTSDGRFIAKICPQVIEFGPRNATIHQINEHVDEQDIEPLKNIYLGMIERLLGA